MFDALKRAFARAEDNFELGLAGASDLIGLTHDKAAEVYTEQQAATFSTQQEQDLALANAKRAEDAGGILKPALKMTSKAVRETLGDAAGELEDMATETLVAAALVVAAVGAAAFYFRAELRAGARKYLL